MILEIFYKLFITIGVLLIIYEINKTKNRERIIYKYLPNNFEQDQLHPQFVSDIFYDMFNKSDMWIIASDDLYKRNPDSINKGFISN